MDILKIIADNPELLSAVKEVLKDEFDTPMAEVSQLNDKSLGERVRARMFGLTALDRGFQKILLNKTPQKPSESKNPAR